MRRRGIGGGDEADGDGEGMTWRWDGMVRAWRCTAWAGVGRLRSAEFLRQRGRLVH
jgi:hypothetical protein